ncbi:LGFP repeat-containing protein [Microbacterium insulae]|uniref:LGFP repeat-containing protein n=1 Tax=Microbacterium insulae TaxID=483014 RepID=A0ABW3AET9_9MICO
MVGARDDGARARMKRTAAATIAIVAMTLGILAAPAAAAAAGASGPSATTGIVKAADLSKFQAGNIISDAVFFNRSTMTESQIQSFLQSKVSSCRSGYTCLKDYYDTSRTTTADAMCGAYSGGVRERASRIIYKVAQACGINPQVILVMLQKEQGLILSSAPSSYNYRAAMGQGCPDTAACDTRYYGFFNQVFGGAWQMKRYANPPGTSQFFTWYAPGKTWNILWHPNSACGTSPVYVQNQATANLYYYTPYRPNAAAIRAGYGTGDSCSSYGNRNFYQFFTDWFGSTQSVAAPASYPVSGAIATEWKRMGGAAGGLGRPLAAAAIVTDPNGNGVAQKFEGGWIHSSSAGTFSSRTAIMVTYSAAGWLRGDLGWPTSHTVCTSNICTQAFAGGIISYVWGEGEGVSTLGVSAAAIEQEHLARGGAAGPLGAPVGAVQVVSDAKGSGLARKYEGGWIHSWSGGTFTTTASQMDAYSSAGWVRGSLGWPTTAEQAVTDPNGNGLAQGFQGGWIHTSESGTFVSPGVIMTAFSAAQWVRGSLGWPSSPFVCTNGACAQRFAGGVISALAGEPAATHAGVTEAAIDQALGAQRSAGSTGELEAAALVVDRNGSGLAKKFDGGWVHSSGYGTFVSSHTVMTAYSSAGWVRGGLGWPTGAETCEATICSQAFDGGLIVYSPGKPAISILDVGPDELAAVRAGADAGLGTAQSAVQVVTDPNGNGLARKYAGGWVHASSFGAFASSTDTMTAYSAARWLRGYLGWPVAPENPITDPNGDGTAQQFAGGWIHSSDAGTFASPTVVMNAYSAAGWLRGELGWPTGDLLCTGTACMQPFEGGIVEYLHRKAAVSRIGVDQTAIATAVAEQTTVTESLGEPQAKVQSVADPRGSGLAQRYANGWVHSSARGTFVSSATVMAAYSKAGWVRGALGWPTGAETCSADLCTQTFVGGTISYTEGAPATVKLN